MNRLMCFVLMCGVLAIAGCNPSPAKSVVKEAKTPVFVHSFSEYPSWSVFGVADQRGIINGEQGKQSTLEKEWNVDIVLKQSDYDTCLTQFGSNTVDSSCLTTLDSLAPSLGRPSVVILPTSTSDGADMLIMVGGQRDDRSVEELKTIPVYGLEKSVSQYAFERCLISRGKNPKDYVYRNMDPAAAAQAMQTNQPNVNAIMVWNPFALQTLRTRTEAKKVFSSDVLKEEIIDAVVVGKDALNREGGDRFAACLIEAFYQVNSLIDTPATSDQAVIDLGVKFSNLGLEDMKTCLEQTKFYNTPERAEALFKNEKFRKQTMPMVVDFAVKHEIVPSSQNANRIGFENDDALLNFTTKYIEKARNGK